MKSYTRCILVIFFAVCNKLSAQVPKDSELFRRLKSHDSLFFERAFNQCDLHYLETAIDSGLIFYHDQGGVQNRDKFIENTKLYICGDSIRKPIRKVDVQSLEVYPMYNSGMLYAVVQTGVHNFYIKEKYKDEVLTSCAKFIHLYLLINDKWILKEVISFDHQPPE